MTYNKVTLKMGGILDFLEAYLPEYYRSSDVARLDDISKILSGESDEDVTEAAKINLFHEFNEIQDKLFLRALPHYKKG